jgi:hypothetical protein
MMSDISSTASAKYPDCVVELSGVDGNIFVIIAHVRTALYRYLTSNEIMRQPEARAEQERLTADITAQDSYEDALAVIGNWMTVE